MQHISAIELVNCGFNEVDLRRTLNLTVSILFHLITYQRSETVVRQRCDVTELQHAG